MRLLQLQPNGSETNALDLHPMLTVVTGLTPAGRARVLQAFTAIPRAGDPGCGGLIEAHGVLLDLTAPNLSMLGFTDVDLDVLVRPDDIPASALVRAQGAPSSAATVRVVADAPVEASPAASPSPSGPPVDATWVIDNLGEGESALLDEARRAVASALEATGILGEAGNRAREGHADAMVTRLRLAAEVEAAVAELAVAEAGTERRVERAATEAPREPAPPKPKPDTAAAEAALARDRSILEGRIEGLSNRRAQILRSLSELAAIDVKPIEVLLEAIRNPAPTVMMPSERANELADEIVELRRQLASVEARLDAEGFSITQAEERLERAKIELGASEVAMAKPTLSTEDIANLEEAHEQVLEAEAKAGGRIGGKAGKRRLEEALAAQQAILDRVGFPTWSAYVMGAGLLGIDPVAEQRLDRARAEVDQAEANWAVITETLEHDPEYRGLLDGLEAVYLEAFDLLGGDSDDDLEVALRHLEVAVQEVTTDDLTAAMAYQFELLGLDLGPSPQLEMLVMAAEAILEEAAAIAGRLSELSIERTGVEKELRIAQIELRNLPATVPDPEPDPMDGFEPVIEGGPAYDIVVEVSAEDVAAARQLLSDAEERLRVAVEEEDEYLELVEARAALADAADLALGVARSKLRSIAADLAATMAPQAADVGEPVSADADAVALPVLELVEDPGADDLDAVPVVGGAPAGAGNRFLDILDDLPYSGDEPEVAVPAPDDVDEETEAALSQVEFYLLARLAALRNLSFAGSVPLLIDDALGVLAGDMRTTVLERIERMAGQVQIVYLTDDPVIATWADGAGITRAAVVQAPAQLG